MAVKKKPLPAQSAAKEKAIYKLVSTLGVNKSHCIKSLGLSPNYFQHYIGAAENFEKATAAFTQLLMKATMKNIDFSDSNRKYLIQKTRCMDVGIDLPKIVDNKSARVALGLAIQRYSLTLLVELVLSRNI